MEDAQTLKPSRIQYVEPEELPNTVYYLYVNKREDLLDFSSGHLRVIKDAKSSIVPVPVRNIRSSQPVVSPEHVQEIMESGAIKHLPCLATGTDGLFYVLEGNHRINAEIQRGKEEVLCRVFYI